MKTTAAVLYEAGKPLEIEELELDAPGEGEILVRYTHAGLCHSDLHVMQGQIECRTPMVLGHEGAGVVEEVGPGVTRVRPGDHVVCSFVPSCGSCHWCATGQQAICDWGAATMLGYLPGEHWPLSGPAGHYGTMCMVGAFSQYGVIHQYSAVRVDPDLPLSAAALASCGVPTGWGSAVNAGNVRPGQTVVIYGIGGIGANAVQGARFAGARYVVAVDPVAHKRDAALTFGATHTAADAPEAQEIVQELTRGVGADASIVTVGTTSSEVIDSAFRVVGKAGTVVLTSMGGGFRDRTIQLPAQVATLWKKTIKGSLFGDCNPTTDIPRLLDLYRTGDLKLDELITQTYRLEEVNEGYDDLLAGRNLRGMIEHAHD